MALFTLKIFKLKEKYGCLVSTDCKFCVDSKNVTFMCVLTSGSLLLHLLIQKGKTAIMHTGVRILLIALFIIVSRQTQFLQLVSLAYDFKKETPNETIVSFFGQSFLFWTKRETETRSIFFWQETETKRVSRKNETHKGLERASLEGVFLKKILKLFGPTQKI